MVKMMFLDPTFWVATAFVAFIALIYFLKVPSSVVDSLDKRSEKIKSDLNQAEALCKDAQDLLAMYQKKQRDAVKESETITTEAEKTAQDFLRIGRNKIAETASRRQELTSSRIKQAEIVATEKVQSKTSEIVIAATTSIIKGALKNERMDKTIEGSIASLGAKLK